MLTRAKYMPLFRQWWRGAPLRSDNDSHCVIDHSVGSLANVGECGVGETSSHLSLKMKKSVQYFSVGTLSGGTVFNCGVLIVHCRTVKSPSSLM